MGPSAHAFIESRSHQMFPTLEPREIERLGRFGELRHFDAGERLVETGEVAAGMFVILRGEVAVTQRSVLGHEEAIVTHGAGAFLGELNQLSGRPSLVDAHAVVPVDAVVVPPPSLRGLMVAEAELGERIMRALILRRVGLLQSGVTGPLIVGGADDGGVLRLAGFLSRNGQPHQTLDPATDSCARTLVERFDIQPSELPIVLCASGQLLRNPTERELASCLGLVRPIDPERIHDVTIVGAGPAGLAAAVYAASEGLSVVVVDGRAFGGQAGASARIENYLGFPTGISGMALMARAFNQAEKFGAEMLIPSEVVCLRCGPAEESDPFQLELASGERLRTRAVVVASGARYRRIDAPNLEEFEAASVHYWATPLEVKLCAGQEVAVVGAGNSAGQAVVHLASEVAQLRMLVRGPSLEASMSRYLVDRIAGLPNVEVLLETQVTGLEGRNGRLEAVRWRHRPTGRETLRPIHHLYLFIGADPNTEWLSRCGVAVDDRGFVRTGADLGNGSGSLETSIRGVFAIGDVRAGSVKRVAAAVGEGAQVVAAVHAFLAGRRAGASAPGGPALS